MSILHLKTRDEFDAQVLNSKVPVIVDFSAKWCPPCRKMEKVFEEEIKQSNGWNIVQLNCDDEDVKGLAQKHGVSGIPAVFFYHNGLIEKDYSFTGFNQEVLKQVITYAASLIH